MAARASDPTNLLHYLTRAEPPTYYLRYAYVHHHGTAIVPLSCQDKSASNKSQVGNTTPQLPAGARGRQENKTLVAAEAAGRDPLPHIVFLAMPQFEYSRCLSLEYRYITMWNPSRTFSSSSKLC